MLDRAGSRQRVSRVGGRRRGVCREEANARQTVQGVPVNTRTIAIVALIIAVIVLIVLLM
jgi:hypothetical protein